MVLDAKALTWAATNNIDTAKLKAAKIPIYGKWYFPEIPSGIALVNLESGERAVFPERMLAGEVIFAPEAELRRAGLLPADFPAPEDLEGLSAEGAEPATGGALQTIAPEPLLAIARPPGVEHPGYTAALVPAEARVVPYSEPADVDVGGIHMPLGSIAPFVLGLGFCILLLGLITNVFIVIVGMVWMLAGAIGWIRIGMLELAAGHGHAEDDDETEAEEVA
jgi:hypothetical protein